MSDYIQTTMRLSEDLYERLRSEAFESRTPQNSIVIEALARHLDALAALEGTHEIGGIVEIGGWEVTWRVETDDATPTRLSLTWVDAGGRTLIEAGSDVIDFTAGEAAAAVVAGRAWLCEHAERLWHEIAISVRGDQSIIWDRIPQATLDAIWGSQGVDTERNVAHIEVTRG